MKKRLTFVLLLACALVSVLASSCFAESATENDAFSASIKSASKQTVSVNVTTKDSSITKYRLTLSAESLDRSPFDNITPKTASFSHTFATRVAPDDTGYVLVVGYNKNGQKVSSEMLPFTMDGTLFAPLRTKSETYNFIRSNVYAHKKTFYSTSTSKYPYRTIYSALAGTKWGFYYTNGCLWSAETFPVETYTYNGKTVYLTEFICSYYLSKAEDEKLQKKYTSVANAATGSTKSKVKYFTKYLAKNNKYKVTNKLTTYSFMLGDRKGQCKHYADAFKILCDLKGIKCEWVYGTVPGRGGHGWNEVKVGSKWYYHDPCWADGGSRVSTKWFCRGSRDRNFTKKHVLAKDFKTSAWKKAHPISPKNLGW